MKLKSSNGIFNLIVNHYCSINPKKESDWNNY